MPVIHFHLVEGRYSDKQHEALLLGASVIYCEILESPMDRVRAFIKLYRPELVAIAGQRLSSGDDATAYFEFIVLQGRPLEQRHSLMSRFSQLVADTLDLDLSLVRGACWEVPPENWAIGGVPASELRRAEIDARRQV